MTRASKTRSPAWHYDAVEIRADGAVHVLGCCLAIVGAVVVVGLAFMLGPAASAVGAVIYALCLIATLLLSALYNMWPVSPRKWVLRRFDHAGIFLLIAGTYTPFAIHMGMSGRHFLYGLWAAAVAGMVLKIVFAGRFDRLAVILYLAVGWSGLALFEMMPDSLGMAATVLILIGGFVYSLGVIFHLWEKLRFQNVIWHAFVLAGAACHYAAVIVSIVANAHAVA